ncbi:MAG: hypothetical protein JW995_11745 [Melioribacteraceae bacterium]|nr:hypothetical protein [Melioribacteraceae bacterium]
MKTLIKDIMISVLVMILLLVCDTPGSANFRGDISQEPIIQQIEYEILNSPGVFCSEDTTKNKAENSKSSVKENGVKSITELWETYKKAKSEVSVALENNEIKKVISNLIVAGECAMELGRPGIASWQYNNIGHYSIEEFKRLTDYDNRIRNLATLKNSTERKEYLNQTKSLFRQHFTLLETAEKHLLNAQIIDDELEKSRRTNAIEKNIEFINWVRSFIN